MTKQSIALVVSASVILTIAACKRDDVEQEARDVEKAREEVREEQRELGEQKREGKQELEEAKTELRKEQAELGVEIDAALKDTERRYENLDKQAMAAVEKIQAGGGDITTGIGAELHQARMLAKAKLEAARNAKTVEQMQAALNDAKDHLDKLERKLEEHQGEV